MQACRERANLSQEELAAKLNTSRSSISKIENDRVSFDVQMLLKWAEVTSAKEVVVAFLYGMEGLSIVQSMRGVA
ncbi:helix-turn-helix domain-containing protein [Paenibacillus sp. MMS18-CY102]|nr:helix-turn-helix domain-containing protein [Paenibacillus sp. MMS18-CY102]